MHARHVAVLLILALPLSRARNMVFQFHNPSFGGNPNNGAFLSNSVQAQNSHKDPGHDNYGIEIPSALDNFTRAVQSQTPGGLSINISTGKLGRMVTNDLIIDIANRNRQLRLNVADRKSGKASTIEVSGL